MELNGLTRFPTHVPLNRRENHVLLCLGRGMSDKAIGQELGLHEDTVTQYLCRLRKKDPNHFTRHNAVRILARDHERKQAIKLNEWIKTWRDRIPEKALAEINEIMASQVAEVLR